MANQIISESADIQAILRGIWRRHKLFAVSIFFCLAVPGLLAVYITSPPVFTSVATLAIASSPLEQFSFIRETPKQESISTALTLLKSRSLGQAAAESLPKESLEELLATPFYTDYWLVFTNWIRKWMGKPPTILSPQQQILSELSHARMEFYRALDAAGVLIIKGTAADPRVAMDLVNTYIQVLLNRTRNSSQEDSQRARQWVEMQIQQTRENLAQAEGALTRYQQQKGFIRFGTQTDLDFVKLSQTETALAEAQANWEGLSARMASLRHVVDQSRSREAKSAADAQAKEKQEAASGAPPFDQDARLVTYKAAQDRLGRLEARLSTLRDRYTEAHPLVRAAQEEVAAERTRVAQLAKELPPVLPSRESRGVLATSSTPTDRVEAERQLAALEAEEAPLKTKIESLKLQIGRLKGSLKNVSQEELELNNLRRNVEQQRNLLSSLSDKLMTARIREQGGGLLVQILDPASLPAAPDRTKAQRLFLMVLALAGGIAFGTAFVIEFLHQPIETESDVLKSTGLPVLGSVGVIGEPRVTLTGHIGRQPHSKPIHLIDSPGQSSINIELYRAIRAMVETERLRSPFRSILVTSPNPHEGKSTTSINLANVFRQFGRRVLLVDADLRRPSLHRALSLTTKPGIVDFLNGAATFDQVCRTLPSGVTVIPGQVAGKDAASMFVSSRGKELLDLASAHFDLVIIDSAPLLAVPDNLLLISLLDRVILVVKASSTSKWDLRRAKVSLEKANAQILGVLLNQANPQDVHYYHPKYRKYYKLEEDGAMRGESNHSARSRRGTQRNRSAN